MRAFLLALIVLFIWEAATVLIGLLDEAERWLRRRFGRPRRTR